MTANAIIAGNRETTSPWIAETLSALGYEPAATAAADRPEDGQYYLAPGLVEQTEELLDRTEASMLVVDGQPHIGQLADLRERLSGVSIHDHRSLVWKRLATSNPVADARLTLRDTRLERRLAERVQRQQDRQSPDGVDGQVAHLDEQCDAVRDRLSDQRRKARSHVTAAHTDADTYVVMARTVCADTPVGRQLLRETERSQASGPVCRPETSVASVGVHRVGATDIPAVPWPGHTPDWFEAVVPGAIAALERADIVCSGTADLAAAFADRFDATSVTAEQSTGAALRSALTTQLGTVDIDVSFPYADEAHAVVSQLHDRTEVRDIVYGERIELSVTASESAVDTIERQTRDAGGRIEGVSTPKTDDSA